MERRWALENYPRLERHPVLNPISLRPMFVFRIVETLVSSAEPILPELKEAERLSS